MRFSREWHGFFSPTISFFIHSFHQSHLNATAIRMKKYCILFVAQCAHRERALFVRCSRSNAHKIHHLFSLMSNSVRFTLHSGAGFYRVLFCVRHLCPSDSVQLHCHSVHYILYASVWISRWSFSRDSALLLFFYSPHPCSSSTFQLDRLQIVAKTCSFVFSSQKSK